MLKYRQKSPTQPQATDEDMQSKGEPMGAEDVLEKMEDPPAATDGGSQNKKEPSNPEEAVHDKESSPSAMQDLEIEEKMLTEEETQNTDTEDKMHNQESRQHRIRLPGRTRQREARRRKHRTLSPDLCR